MQLVDQALVARLHRDSSAGDAPTLFRLAFEAEREAASLVAQQLDLEPTRSVLLRSAASLALECGEVREAERLIATALSGNAPEDISEELRDLLEQVYFQRHLSLKGVVLAQAEFQVAIDGRAVGFGITESEAFIGRIRDLQTIVYRTAERKLGREFRERGRRSETLQGEVQLYISVPRAASFAVTCRVGAKQMALPGMDIVEEVVNEVLDCLDLYGSGQTTPLRERIPDPAYYRNFVGLARKIAPDGEEVRTVGLTAVRPDEERRVILSAPRRLLPRPIVSPPPGEPAARVEVRGVLKYSDSRNERRGIIQVIDQEQQSHRIRVPAGMMRDIVRPMYEDEVIVVGRRRQTGAIVLETIDPA